MLYGIILSLTTSIPFGSQNFWLAEQVRDLYASYFAGITGKSTLRPHSHLRFNSSSISAFTNITELFLRPPVVPTKRLNVTPFTLNPFNALLKSLVHLFLPSLTRDNTYRV